MDNSTLIYIKEKFTNIAYELVLQCSSSSKYIYKEI